MKALVIASTASMIDQFNIPSIEILQNLGYKVQVACNFHKGNTCDKKEIIALKTKLREMKVEFYDVNFYRDVTNISENIIAYKQLKEIFRRNHYEIVHCHTPIGGVLARIIANKYRNKNTKVLYTAHGFHFYKGAPLKNWLLYFPVEWILSFSTDILITINKEDFALAKRCMGAKKVKYIPGVGIDRRKYSCNSLTNIEKRKIRNDIGINNDEIMLLSVGELSTRKNHEVVIKAIHKLNNKRIKYYICGQGDLENQLQSLINSFNLNENVHLLGFRTDISELCCSADLFIFPSLQEGLSVALMEAMASGLPCVVSRIRGNTDLIEERKNGILCDPNNASEFSNAIELLINNKKMCERMKKYSLVRIQKYDIYEVKKRIKRIYQEAIE